MGIVSFILGGTVLRHENIRAHLSRCGLKEEITIKLGEGFSGTVSMPSYPPIEDEAMSYTRQRQVQGHDPGLRRRTKTQNRLVTPSNTRNSRAASKAMDYDERQSAGAGRLRCRHRKNYSTGPNHRPRRWNPTPENFGKPQGTRNQGCPHLAAQGRYSKACSTNSGKKKEAEFKLGFNPACEEPTNWSAPS